MLEGKTKSGFAFRVDENNINNDVLRMPDKETSEKAPTREHFRYQSKKRGAEVLMKSWKERISSSPITSSIGLTRCDS